jgi:hypothetical protein
MTSATPGVGISITGAFVLISRKEERMKVKHRSFFGWRSLTVVLLMSSLVLLASVGSASAQSATVTYNYFAGSGTPCSITECPDVASAPNGDTITIAGQGTLSIHPDSVTGSGTFIHKDASGTVLGEGTWTAQQLMSFVSYGSESDLPPTFEGGKALVRIHLSPNTGGSGFDAVLRITCLVGSPPPSAREGIRLDIQDVINFNKEVSGDTLFIRTSP